MTNMTNMNNIKITAAPCDAAKFVVEFVEFGLHNIATNKFMEKCKELGGNDYSEGYISKRSGEQFAIHTVMVFTNRENAEAMVEWLNALLVMNKLVS